MLDQFDGNLPLAIASYNAGPGRVNQWIKQFGDPRNPNVDMIDWIETIPVYETRNYVQRVMEGYAVYRMKLARYNRGGREANDNQNEDSVRVFTPPPVYEAVQDRPRRHSLGSLKTAYNP
jgi:soluble lytic murein transglycosylase